MNTNEASLVIINYNSLRFLEELFASIQSQSHPPREVILVDNASSDQSVDMARRLWPGLRVIAFPSNRGFAAAANAGIKASSCEATALLNTDIKLDPEWLGHLLDTLDSDEKIAAAAAKIMLYDQPTLLNGVGGAMNRLGYTWDIGMFEKDQGQYDRPAEIIFAPASAALFRRSAVLECGGFDESFFMYHEDVDLGWRLRLLGYRIVTCPRAVAFHHFGGSTRENRGMLWREILGERNSMTSLLKNYEWPNALAALGSMLGLNQSCFRKASQIRNLLWNLAVLPRTLRKRRQIQRSRVVNDDELKQLIVQSRHVPVRL